MAVNVTTSNRGWVGQELAGGRYHVTAKLGEGGMGQVYRAVDHNLETDVVIKVPHSSMLQDAEFVGRFSREIRSLVRLAHPRIVKINDVGQHGGVPFAVMQFLEGGSLKDSQRTGPRGELIPMRLEETRNWLSGVAEALDFIHSQGYVHRDVKPANILFDAHGNVYMGDFGVVKAVAGSTEAAGTRALTGAGMVLGTPEYMAPELIMGQRYDGRVDQYALAATVHEVLAGSAPFTGATPAAVFIRHSTQIPPALHVLRRGTSEQISNVILKGLSKDPIDRYPNCTSFASNLLEAIAANAHENVGGKVKERVAQSSAACGPQDSVIQLPCPTCLKTVRMTANAGGKQVRCATCQTLLRLSLDLRELEAVLPPVPPSRQKNVARSAPPITLSPAGAPSRSAETNRIENVGVETKPVQTKQDTGSWLHQRIGSFRIHDRQSCAAAIRNGGIAALISAAITTVFALMDDPWTLVDVVLIVVMAVFVFRKSRIASTLLVIYFAASKAMMWYESGTPQGLVVGIIFLLYYVTAMRATYIWHRSYREWGIAEY